MAIRKLAFIDHRANIGGGRRFSASLVNALAEATPPSEIRLIATREALDGRAFGEIASPSIKLSGLVTEETVRRWIPDGRVRGIPGTWRLKSAIQTALLKSVYRFDRQLERSVQDAELVYLAWPYFIDYQNFGKPVVATLHDVTWKYTEAFTAEQQATLDTHIPRWLSECAAVVTSTNFMRQEIERIYPQRAKRVHVIPLPTNPLPQPMLGTHAAEFLTQRNIHQPFALCPAGLWQHKNHENLIQAFARLKRRRLTLSLVCTGLHTDEAFGAMTRNPIWERAKCLRRQAIDLGLVPGVDVIGLGHVSDLELATLYSTAQGLVMPVLLEAGSFPILEAAAQGVPLACSNIPVYREQAELYGLHPFYFDPRSPETIADAVEQLVQIAHAAEELTAAAQRVHARTWLDVAKEYLQVFESVVG